MIIGIDGGGSTTRMFIQHREDEPQYFEFPISIKVRSGDYAASAEKLRKIVSQTFTDRSDHEPVALWIGLSGMGQPHDQEQFRNALIGLPEFQRAAIQIESDAIVTMKSVLREGEEGILLIAGTGSVLFYQPLGESPRRIGGWGPFLSDEGSGYSIGLRALRYYVNVLDGVYPRAPLFEAIDLRIGDMEKTPKALSCRAETDPTFVASFAQDVFETAATQKLVQDMLHDELVNLVALIFPLFASGVLSGTKPYPLYLVGRIARHPRTVHIIEQAFDDGELEIHTVDERAPAYKALELARKL